MMYSDVMLDIETLGTNCNSVILSVAAIPFNIDSGEIKRELSFYEKIDIDSCLQAGLQVDGATIYWWLRNSDEARAQIEEGKRPLSEALFMLSNWLDGIRKMSGSRAVQVWSNGLTFDVPILSNAYKNLYMSVPWDYHDTRDVRTYVSIFPEIRKDVEEKRERVAHHPIDDCLLQIEYVSGIQKKLNSKKS